MNTRLCVIILLLSFTSPVLGMESSYTELTAKACRVVEQTPEGGEGDWSRSICPGVAGYRLALLGDDLRISIDVISPDGKEHPLNLWKVISTHFTDHGEKVEWRLAKRGKESVPQALIVRVNAYEFSDKPDQIVSYLAVAKITTSQVCVTAKIKPGPKQNEEARLAADAAAHMPCLQAPGH